MWKSIRSALRRSAETIDVSVGRLVGLRGQILVWMIVLGFLFVVTSATLNIGMVEFSGKLTNGFDVFAQAASSAGDPIVAHKEVGFLFAANWSLFCTLIAPLIIWFGLSTIRAFDITLRGVCDRGMVRSAAFRRISYDMLKGKWIAHSRANRLLFTLVLLAVVAFVMSDWWSVVGAPLLDPDAVRNPLSDPRMEYDWSVAALFAGSQVDTTALLLFTFLAYLIYAGLVPALVIAVTICTIYFMVFVTTIGVGGSSDDTEIAFAAVPADEDDMHFGFKSFAPLFNNYLLMSLFIMLGLWLMAVQNVYLRDTNSADIAQFVWGDIDQYVGLFRNSVGAADFIAWFVAPSRFIVFNIQVALSALLMPIICVISVVGCWFILRNKALEARDHSRRNIAKLSKELGISAERLDERLKHKMEVWPVGWITSDKLLATMALLFVSLVSYRLIVIPIVFGSAIGLVAILKLLMKRKSSI